MRANEDLRKYAADNGVKMWELAAELHYHEGTFCKKMRFELSAEDKKKAREAIDKIKSNRGSMQTNQNKRNRFYNTASIRPRDVSVKSVQQRDEEQRLHWMKQEGKKHGKRK